jgi:hypothetical protein
MCEILFIALIWWHKKTPLPTLERTVTDLIDKNTWTRHSSDSYKFLCRACPCTNNYLLMYRSLLTIDMNFQRSLKQNIQYCHTTTYTLLSHNKQQYHKNTLQTYSKYNTALFITDKVMVYHYWGNLTDMLLVYHYWGNLTTHCLHMNMMLFHSYFYRSLLLNKGR